MSDNIKEIKEIIDYDLLSKDAAGLVTTTPADLFRIPFARDRRLMEYVLRAIKAWMSDESANNQASVAIFRYIEEQGFKAESQNELLYMGWRAFQVLEKIASNPMAQLQVIHSNEQEFERLISNLVDTSEETLRNSLAEQADRERAEVESKKIVINTAGKSPEQLAEEVKNILTKEMQGGDSTRKSDEESEDNQTDFRNG